MLGEIDVSAMYVAAGGMPGPTFIQVVAAVLVISIVSVTALVAPARFHWSPDRVLGTAMDKTGVSAR